jgi:hypothetical protein
LSVAIGVFHRGSSQAGSQRGNAEMSGGHGSGFDRPLEPEEDSERRVFGMSIRWLRVRVSSSSLNRSSHKIRTCGYRRFWSRQEARQIWNNLGTKHGWYCGGIGRRRGSECRQSANEIALRKARGDNICRWQGVAAIAINRVVVEAFVLWESMNTAPITRLAHALRV